MSMRTWPFFAFRRPSMNPKQWYEQTIGKSIDTDGAYGPQCWDYFDYFCRRIGFKGSRQCASTGYAGDLWMLRDADGYNYSTAFDYITNPAEFITGDWVFWPQHVAMFYEGGELGQNQSGHQYVTLQSMNWNGILGAMRWRGWSMTKIPAGYNVMTINGHVYRLRRMTGSDKIAVLSAGLNNVKPIRELDGDALINSKIGGANYYQMKDDQPDPYGTTYGDLSAPYNGVYQTLPNQHTTLFYDLSDGRFGDCTGVTIDSTHNVFSPALVFPNSKGHWEYAEMVGLSHKDLKSWYNFLIRVSDGYVTGQAMQQMTPQEIADDFAETDMVNIAFLDGGGSAQAGFWHDGSMDYQGGDDRPLPSVIVTYRDYVDNAPVEMPEMKPVDPPTTVETPTEEETPMSENKPVETPTQIPDWKDPEEADATIKHRISSLLSVKSIVTLILTVVFASLVLNEKKLPEDFTRIYLMVISIFFGYQFDKKK